MNKTVQLDKKLQKLAGDVKHTSLKQLFQDNPERGEEYSLAAESIDVDYSKNLIDKEILSLLHEYAEVLKLPQRIQSLHRGDVVNLSEGRAALHSSLRDINNLLGIDKNTHHNINQTRTDMFRLANKLSNGELKNHQNQAFKHMVCIGIGGSYLGPKLICSALGKSTTSEISIDFLSSIDPDAFEASLNTIELDRTVFFIASKSFTTLEVLHNAEKIKQRLLAHGVPESNIPDFFIAATANTSAALEFGCSPDRILPLWDFIGGRFSLWSSIGLPVLVTLGEHAFLQLLESAHQIDVHFFEKTFQDNMPVTLALISFWYQKYLSIPSQAVIPYSHGLKHLPSYLQQLDMESLGKSVDLSGQAIQHPTGAIIWGGEGPDSQHAFHQLLLQGTHKVACDFIIAKNNPADQNSQNLMLAQCFSQSAALAFGNNDKDPAKHVPGNQTSNTILLDQLSASSMGQLLALYENKVFALSVLLDINAFDQWGVELGKTITQKTSRLINHPEENGGTDSSTATLVSKLTTK